MSAAAPEALSLTVIKLNTHLQETWRYQALVRQRLADRIVVEAYFDHEDRLLHGMPLCRGDRFVETYFPERWYNIFEIHSRENDQLRGWYCNISKPAVIGDDHLAYVDLALDLLVFPDGRQIVLDEDEFAALNLTPSEREAALAALEELQKLFVFNGQPPPINSGD